MGPSNRVMVSDPQVVSYVCLFEGIKESMYILEVVYPKISVLLSVYVLERESDAPRGMPI
jgi:hypothetical protein